ERVLRLSRSNDYRAGERKETALFGAECPFRWLARWALSAGVSPNNHLFEQHDTASRPAAAYIGELRACPYGWRHSRLCLSGECRVVGDIFSNHFYPIIDLASGGSIDGMIHSLDEILARTDEQTKIVPGHGPVATRADLVEYRDMLVQVRQRIMDLIAAGKTIDEAVAAAPTKQFDAKWGSGYVPPNVFTKMVFSSLTYGGSASR